MIEQLKESGFTFRWLLQASSGVLLVILLAVHLIVNHWAAPHGLLGYADIVRYYDQPGIIWMESIFLIVITSHSLLGLHAIVLDLNVSPRIARSLAQALILIGVFVILYGLWLIISIHSLSVSS
jgi:succinate dehydrogenase / fumarate reductase membrane anchor subunit